MKGKELFDLAVERCEALKNAFAEDPRLGYAHIAFQEGKDKFVGLGSVIWVHGAGEVFLNSGSVVSAPPQIYIGKVERGKKAFLNALTFGHPRAREVDQKRFKVVKKYIRKQKWGTRIYEYSWKDAVWRFDKKRLAEGVLVWESLFLGYRIITPSEMLAIKKVTDVSVFHALRQGGCSTADATRLAAGHDPQRLAELMTEMLSKMGKEG